MKLKITVHGTAYEVDVEVLDAGEDLPVPSSPLPRVNAQGCGKRPISSPIPPRSDAPTNGAITSPIAGTVLEVPCKEGDTVEKGQVLVVVEAMKMEAAINAPSAGKLGSVEASVGDAIREGQVVARYV